MKTRWEVDLLRCITEVQEQVIEDVEPRVVFDNLLSHLLELTESEYGFIGEVLRSEVGAPYLKTHAITNIAWDDETRAFYDEFAPDGLVFRNMNTLFGAAILSEEPVIANDPASDPRRGGYPSAHPRLHAFLGLPFHRQDRLIGMVGVANRPGGYDAGLVQRMKPFLAVCANTIEAFATQRERESAEAALRESEQRYRRLVEDQPELLCRFDPDFTLTFVNRAYADFSGKTIADCRGSSFLDLIPHTEHEVVLEHFRSIDNARPVARLEHQVVGGSGEIRWMQWTNRALFNARGEIVELQSLGLDVTERRNLDTKLRQVQKLESLGVLAGGVAHDFNNLLTGILGNANLAMAQLSPASSIQHHLEQIETASCRAADMCAQLLAYSGKGMFVPKAVDLSWLVQDMVRMLELSISKKAVLELNLPPDVPAIEADETQIRQVVMNLITNASEALDGRAGTIRVSTGVQDCEPANLRDSFLDDELPGGKYAVVEVADSGSGMTEETIAKIFDPFFSTKFAGRGLGLAAALGIVRGHRGAIRVDSEPGRGTSVTILFPVSARRADAPETRRPRAEDRDRSGLILVIDDEAAVREVVRTSLESHGFQVLLATNGLEGLELFRERTDEISVVLLDLTMPQLGGEEVLHEIRQIRHDARVVLSSGYSEHDVADRLAGVEPTGFLQKPFGSSDLLMSIDASLAKRR